MHLLCLNAELRNMCGRRYFFPASFLAVGFFFLVQPYLVHLMMRALKFPFKRINLHPCPSYVVTTGDLEGAWEGAPYSLHPHRGFQCHSAAVRGILPFFSEEMRGREGSENYHNLMKKIV